MFKKASLNRRLNALLLVCFVPLTIMIIYLMAILFRFSERYDKSVQNITKANAYNIEFKDDLDYTMYIIVVNSERAKELVDTQQPHELIDQARTVFSELSEKAEGTDGKTRLQRIVKSLDTLEDHVSEVEANAQISGMYDKNLESLDFDIRNLTELIQEQIQQYIYYEATHLETLRANIRQDVQRAIGLSVLIFCIIFFVSQMISRRITGEITEDIRQLLKVTKKAGRGDFSVRADADNSSEELMELAQGFNQMVEHLDTLVEDIRVEQLNLRATEQKLLQAQINPHFLYNTLDAIIWLAEANQKEQVIMMVSTLSDFFRTTLSNGRDFISVKEEESHIRSYLQIQQFRYQDILQYEIDIPEELYRYQILKLTLQPLVENALYHGIKNKRGMGRISVSGRKENGQLIFIITDNGQGMTRERMDQVGRMMNGEKVDSSNTSGFGLYNVVQRIRLNYGPEYGLFMSSAYGEGTEFMVVIPAIKN
ncbi:MAG: sensor histidine kinase [Eubacteriales bacterium]|nr:sensor histidine kinase [Eubacteriales bacterium]